MISPLTHPRRSIPATLLAATLAVGTALPAAASTDSPPTAITFSGGGYHALSGAAAWLMGMMERTGTFDLAEITRNAEMIGANSGGSWFTMLGAYSPSFAEELQQPGAYLRFAGSESGYMGKVWNYIHQLPGGCTAFTNDFDKGVCNAFLKVTNTAGMDAGFVKFLLSGGGQWQTVVENSVFGKAAGWDYYPEVAKLTLADQRNPWAQGRDLVLAGTLLTEAPSLTYTRRTVTGLNYVQTLQGSQAYPPANPVPGGVPLMLSSADGVALDLLPGGTLNLEYGTWSRKGVKWDFRPLTETTLENSDANRALPTLPVINAAAISSAAGGGFIDIPVFKGNLPIAAKDFTTALNGFAPAYQMAEGADGTPLMAFHANVHQAFVDNPKDADAATRKLAANKVVRTADGGYIDNTAVAQTLRYLQDANNGTIPAGFNIVAFDNLPAPQGFWNPKQQSGAFPTGGDIAALFGFNTCDKKGCTMQKEGLHDMKLFLSYQGVSAQLFPADQYFQAEGDGGAPLDRVFWSPNDEERILCDIGGKQKEQPLIYSRYPVNVDADAPGSKLFGITPSNDNVAGTLHVFAFLGAGAAVVPDTADEFACFNTAVTTIGQRIMERGKGCDTSRPRGEDNRCTLGDYLESALGL